MTDRVEGVNPAVLKECREQLYLTLEEVQKKVSTIEQMEEGNRKPTFKQLETIAELYNVPRWVFIQDELPEEFRYEKIVPGFRQIKENAFFTPKTSATVSKIMARINSLREFIIDISDDIDQKIPDFNPPAIANKAIEDVAHHVRAWLGASAPLALDEWKEKLEKKGIFIFMTSKYKSWSKVDRTLFRGLAIHYEKLPIIIINDSDANKAQSFTLFHELGHLLCGKSAIDNWTFNSQVEDWCDDLAGAILMPKERVVAPIHDIPSLKKGANAFKVSPYAYLVRQKRLDRISQDLYNKLGNSIKDGMGGATRTTKANFGARYPVIDLRRSSVNMAIFIPVLFFTPTMRTRSTSTAL